jgi:hypothetical protein
MMRHLPMRGTLLLALLLASPAAWAARVELDLPAVAAPEVPWSGTGALGVGGVQGWEAATLSTAIESAVSDPRRGLPAGFSLPTEVAAIAGPQDVPVVPAARLDGPLGGAQGTEISRWAEVRELLGAGLLVTGEMEVPEAEDRVTEEGSSGSHLGPRVCILRVARGALHLRVLDASSAQVRLARQVPLIAQMQRCGSDRVQADVGLPSVDEIARDGIPTVARAVADLVAPRWVVHRIVLEKTKSNAAGLALLKSGQLRAAAAMLLEAADATPSDGHLQVAAAVALAGTHHHAEARRRMEVALVLEKRPAWERLAAQLGVIAREAERLRRMGLAMYPAHLTPAASR